MMQRTPLHLARLDGDRVEVLESYDIARGFLDVAIELWQLAGREDRATAIEALITSAYELEPPRWERAQIARLPELLDGLEPALRGTVTDGELFLPTERVEELRGRVDAIDLGSLPGTDARNAIQEALVYVDHLRDIATEALARDASVLFD
jgi:hypothetical protein